MNPRLLLLVSAVFVFIAAVTYDQYFRQQGWETPLSQFFDSMGVSEFLKQKKIESKPISSVNINTEWMNSEKIIQFLSEERNQLTAQRRKILEEMAARNEFLGTQILPFQELLNKEKGELLGRFPSFRTFMSGVAMLPFENEPTARWRHYQEARAQFVAEFQKIMSLSSEEMSNLGRILVKIDEVIAVDPNEFISGCGPAKTCLRSRLQEAQSEIENYKAVLMRRLQTDFDDLIHFTKLLNYEFGFLQQNAGASEEYLAKTYPSLDTLLYGFIFEKKEIDQASLIDLSLAYFEIRHQQEKILNNLEQHFQRLSGHLATANQEMRKIVTTLQERTQMDVELLKTAASQALDAMIEDWRVFGENEAQLLQNFQDRQIEYENFINRIAESGAIDLQELLEQYWNERAIEAHRQEKVRRKEEQNAESRAALQRVSGKALQEQQKAMQERMRDEERQMKERMGN